MNYERFRIENLKANLFDTGCLSLGTGSALAVYSPFSFLMPHNLESLVNHGTINPANSFLHEMAQEYFTHGAYLVSGGFALMGLGVCLLSRSHRINIPPVKEYIED